MYQNMHYHVSYHYICHYVLSQSVKNENETIQLTNTFDYNRIDSFVHSFRIITVHIDIYSSNFLCLYFSILKLVKYLKSIRI